MADKSFADYVKDLMGVLPTVNSNPMLSVTSMTDENARYREDPFYMSRDIAARDALAAEEARKKRLAAQSGLFGAMPSSNDGMNDSPMGRNGIQEREAQLRAANLPEDEIQAIMAAEQEARGKAINDFLTNLSKGGLFGIASQLLGGTLREPGMNVPIGVATGMTPAPIAQQQSNNSGGGTTYTPGSLQETLNRTGGILTPQQAQAVVNYNSGMNDSGGGGSVGYGGQDGRGGQTDSTLTGYTE